MKDKIEQYLASKGHEFTGTIGANGTYGTHDYFVDLIQQCLNELQPQWVSVDDRLPKEKVEVLFRVKWQGIKWCLKTGWIKNQTDGILIVIPADRSLKGREVTHWQSLPLPPSTRE
tara:strand:+ start:182 stop:529 length:348 start_codon:yes stop_codon:yes gene_type:complete